MTSARKMRANRANARQSTGPKSAPGKARAAANARRHGLSQDILADPSAAEGVEALAQRLTTEAGRPDLIDLARRFAVAHMNVLRTNHHRHDLLVQAQAALAWARQSQGEAARHLAVLDGLTAELKTIDRYERRARSRRKFAIRDFDRARGAPTRGLFALARLRTGVNGLPRPVRAGDEPICLDQYRAELKLLRQKAAVSELCGRAALAKAAQERAEAAPPERSDREKLQAMLAQIADPEDRKP